MSQPAVVMTKPSHAEKEARTVTAILSRLKAASAQLDADLTSTLPAAELSSVYGLLQHVYDLSNSVNNRRAVKVDEALVYLRDTRLCEVLLSLLRRWPWSEMHSDAMSGLGLALLPGLLGTLASFLEATARVRSSQQAAAHAELSKWCRSQARALPPCCADSSCDKKAVSVHWLLCLCLPSTDMSLPAGTKACGCTRC